MTQLVTFIIHCAKHMWDSYIYVPNVCQQTEIQTTMLTVSNVQSNIQRHAFVYLNIVHVEVAEAAVL